MGLKKKNLKCFKTSSVVRVVCSSRSSYAFHLQPTLFQGFQFSFLFTH